MGAMLMYGAIIADKKLHNSLCETQKKEFYYLNRVHFENKEEFVPDID